MTIILRAFWMIIKPWTERLYVFHFKLKVMWNCGRIVYIIVKIQEKWIFAINVNKPFGFGCSTGSDVSQSNKGKSIALLRELEFWMRVDKLYIYLKGYVVSIEPWKQRIPGFANQKVLARSSKTIFIVSFSFHRDVPRALILRFFRLEDLFIIHANTRF